MDKSKVNIFFIMLLIVGCQVTFSQSDFNKLDEKALKHGVWKGFYEESKRQRYEGTFNHGKEEGVFYFFDDTKAKDTIATRTFNKKDNSAYTIFYNQNNTKVCEGKEVNKLYDGEWIYYHKNSEVIMTKEYYKNGKLNGKRTVFFINGKLAEEVNYVNGMKQGKYKKYAENGVVLEESNFKNDQYEGEAVYRDPSGNVAAEGKYVANKKTGIWKFYVNGKLVSTDNMSFPQNKAKKSKETKK